MYDSCGSQHGGPLTMDSWPCMCASPFISIRVLSSVEHSSPEVGPAPIRHLWPSKKNGFSKVQNLLTLFMKMYCQSMAQFIQSTVRHKGNVSCGPSLGLYYQLFLIPTVGSYQAEEVIRGPPFTHLSDIYGIPLLSQVFPLQPLLTLYSLWRCFVLPNREGFGSPLSRALLQQYELLKNCIHTQQ